MKLPFIDHMRGMAILLVMVIHSAILVERSFLTESASETKGIFAVLMLGGYGVEVFFFISGFLMSHLYDDREAIGFQADFWKKRVSRILPLWIVFASLTYLLFALNIEPQDQRLAPYQAIALQYQTEPTLLNVPIVALLLTYLFLGFLSPHIWNSTVNGGWSIQSEMAHYAIFAWLRKRPLWAWLLLLIALGAFQYWQDHTASASANDAFAMFARLHLFSTLSFFFIGIYSRRIWHEKSVKNLQLWINGPLIGIWVFVLMVVQMPVTNIQDFKPGALWALLVLGGCVLFVLIIKRLAWLSSSLSKVGKYSYFLYFAHFWILFLGKPYFATLAHSLAVDQRLFVILMVSLLVASCLAIGLPFAILSFKYFESPILKLAHKKS